VSSGTTGVTTIEPPLAPPAPMPATEAARRRGPVGLTAACLVLAALFAAPLAYLVARNLGLGDELLEVLGSDVLLGPLRRTVVLATSVALSTAALGTALAWLVMRTDLPFRRFFRVVLALPLVIPSFVGALVLVAAFARGGLADELFGFDLITRPRGFWAAFVVLTLLCYPYVYLPVAARLAALPPSLEESARSLGRSPLEVFRTVVWPQTTGAVAAGALLVFLYVVSDFGAVSLVRYDTLTTRIESSRLFDPTTALVLGLVLAAVALLVVAGERAIGRRRLQTEAVGAGRRPFQANLGAWKAPAVAFTGLVVTIALVAPIAVLSQWAWRGLRAEGGVAKVEPADLVDPALNTAGVAVVAALVAVSAVLPIAYLTTRHGGRAAGVTNALVLSGFALPGLVIALSVTYWLLKAPLGAGLYQTFPPLIFAYVVHFGAQALRSSQVAVGGVPRRVDDAARSLGAGRWRRMRTVDVPLMLPGLAAGAGLVLLSTMKELPATLLLAPTGFDTLATRIWSATESGAFGRAGMAALVLVALSGVLTWFLTIRQMDRVA
jgi:iron(III) transport system permease protein